MMKYAVIGVILLAQLAVAQEVLSDRVRGIRVYGSAEAGFPVTTLESRPITIEFDVTEAQPPDVYIRVIHCDRDWNATNSYFINDEMQNRSRAPLSLDPAPAGVQLYRFHYSVRIPGIAGLERFAHSGNYIFEIVDASSKEVLARGRFFVAEELLTPAMKISNRSLPSEVNPYNQVNRIEVGFALPRPESVKDEIFYPIKLKVVDIYKDRELGNRWRVDADFPSPHSFVDGLGTTKMRFWVDNVIPGNDYRHIDVRDVTDYPEGQELRSRLGADVSRFLQPPRGDHNGVSTITTATRYADYVRYRFELASEYRQYETVFVVGDFNGWAPSPNCTMTYDDDTRRYVWSTSLRRGAYDYQYVVGPNDWMSVEGNDWRTVNVYSAFVYYHDDRLGGYDRIIGFIQRLSPGGNEPTTE
ncbi:MAG: DUF5103 domain-containing protein [Ignavibacteriales bacterium]|nr:DUF5103 domain-containing protein [Ignavibacteriales bacterium]